MLASVIVGGCCPAPGLPDLIVTNITFDPATPDVGDTVHVFITFANQGGEASAMCHWNFAPQADGDIEGILPSLGPGASTTVDDYFTCGWAGSVTTVATADSWYEVPESNEDNNTLTAPLTVGAAPGLPDLIVTNITFDLVTPDVGDTVHVFITIANQGAEASAVCHWNFQPQTAGDIEGVLPSLGSGTSTTVDGYFTCLWAGSVITVATADSWYEVTESNEANNTLTAPLIVGAAPGLPDLIVTNITFDPPTPDVGDTVHVLITIANQGAAASPVYHWHFAPQADGDIEDVLPSLGPGTSTTVDRYFTCASAGSVTTVATADSWYEVTESNEANNTLTAPLIVGAAPGLPDLIVTNITFDPATPGVGDTVHVFITIANQGAAASPVCQWRFAPGTAGIIEGILPGLGPGASTTVDGFFACDMAGSFSTVAVADSVGEVTESNEANNTLTAPLTVGAPGPVTVTLHVIPAESGSVFSDTTVSSRLWVGDDPPNRVRQAFLSFNISGIPPGSTITDVVADFSDYVIIGDPFGSMPFDGCLRVYPDDYGTLDTGDYFAGSPMGAIIRQCSTAELDVPGSYPHADVVSALQSRVGTSRFQLRLQFSPPGTDSDGIQDTVWFGAVELTVTYTP